MDLLAVSVVIPVHRDADGVVAVLDALAAQTLAAERFEVIVADDASGDDTASVAERHGLARVVRLERNGGSYAARNRALQDVRGPLVAFTDADCRPDPDWLERGVARMAEQPELDLLAGRIAVELGPRPSVAALVDFARSLDQERAAVQEDFGATANLWVRRSVFARIGLFNDRLVSGGDTEFGQRAVASGLSLGYRPEVVVRHGPRSRPAQLARKARRLAFGAAQQRVHADPSSRLRTRPLIWSRPGAYLLRFTPVYGIERLEREGIVVSARTRRAMRLCEYLCVQLPAVRGSFEGWRHERRLAGRRP